MPNTKFSRNLNRVLTVAVIAFMVSFGITLNRWLALNQARFETFFFPAVEDFTFRDWQQEPDGTWSAIVWVYKARGECVYIPDQIVTYIGLTPAGETVETTFVSVGDTTPGNNRPDGWQRLDRRQKMNSPEFIPGTRFRGTIMHQCHDGLPTVSLVGEHIVGVDDPFPAYVNDWLENGMKGRPRDYR